MTKSMVSNKYVLLDIIAEWLKCQYGAENAHTLEQEFSILK